MTCTELTLSVLIMLQPWYQDADMSIDERTDLYRPVAETICRVAKNRSEQAWLMAQAYSESKLAKYVIEGNCASGPPGARCDEGLATSVWQTHRHCVGAWKAGPPEQRRDAAARCAIRTARHGVTVCGIRGAFGFQSGRRICNGSWIERRVRLYRFVLARLEAK